MRGACASALRCAHREQRSSHAAQHSGCGCCCTRSPRVSFSSPVCAPQGASSVGACVPHARGWSADAPPRRRRARAMAHEARVHRGLSFRMRGPHQQHPDRMDRDEGQQLGPDVESARQFRQSGQLGRVRRAAVGGCACAGWSVVGVALARLQVRSGVARTLAPNWSCRSQPRTSHCQHHFAEKLAFQVVSIVGRNIHRFGLSRSLPNHSGGDALIESWGCGPRRGTSLSPRCADRFRVGHLLRQAMTVWEPSVPARFPFFSPLRSVPPGDLDAVKMGVGAIFVRTPLWGAPERTPDGLQHTGSDTGLPLLAWWAHPGRSAGARLNPPATLTP